MVGTGIGGWFIQEYAILSTLVTYRTVEHVFFVSKEREHYETYRNILLQLEDPHIDILL